MLNIVLRTSYFELFLPVTPQYINFMNITKLLVKANVVV